MEKLQRALESGDTGGIGQDRRVSMGPVARSPVKTAPSNGKRTTSVAAEPAAPVPTRQLRRSPVAAPAPAPASAAATADEEDEVMLLV